MDRVYIVTRLSTCCGSWHIWSAHRTMAGAEEAAKKAMRAFDRDDGPGHAAWLLEESAQGLVKTWTRDEIGVCIESPELEDK